VERHTQIRIDPVQVCLVELVLLSEAPYSWGTQKGFCEVINNWSPCYSLKTSKLSRSCNITILKNMMKKKEIQFIINFVTECCIDVE
jgi:hypothetical protein